MTDTARDDLHQRLEADINDVYQCLETNVNDLAKQIEECYCGLRQEYDERNYVIISKQIGLQRGELSIGLLNCIKILIVLICRQINNADDIEKQLREKVQLRYENLQHIPNVYDEPYNPLYLDIPKQSLKNLEENVVKYCAVNNGMIETFYNIISQLKKILKSINITHIYYDESYLEVDRIGDILLVDCDDDILYNMMYNKQNWNIFIFINEMLNVKTSYFDDLHDFIVCFITIIRYLPQSEIEYFHRKMNIFIRIVMDEMKIDLSDPNSTSLYNTKFLVIYTYLERISSVNCVDYVNEIDTELIKYAQNAMTNYLKGSNNWYTNKISFKQFEEFINKVMSRNTNGNTNDMEYECYYPVKDHVKVHNLMVKFIEYCKCTIAQYEYVYDNIEETKYVDYLFSIVFGYLHNLEHKKIETIYVKINKLIFEHLLRNRFMVSKKLYKIEQSHKNFNIIYEL